MKHTAEITPGTTDTLRLIDSEFSPDDAFEVMNHLINEKINFHHRRSFSHLIRFGSTDCASQNRIDELSQTLESLRSIISKARKAGKNLRLRSSVEFELV